MTLEVKEKWKKSLSETYTLGLNLTPEANAAGAAFTPKLNAFANNLTRWDLTIEDIQVRYYFYF